MADSARTTSGGATTAAAGALAAATGAAPASGRRRDAKPPRPPPAPGRGRRRAHRGGRRQFTGRRDGRGAARATPVGGPATRAGATAASGATSAAVNPARRYDLAAATALTICPPGDGTACQAEPLPPERREALVRALDRDLARSPQAPAPTPGGPAATLAFDLPDGRRVAIAYDRAAGLLLLPGGDGAVVAPPELAAALPAEPTPPR